MLKGGQKEKKEERPVAKHFAQHHHGETEGLKVKGIYVLKLPERRGDFVFFYKKKNGGYIP